MRKAVFKILVSVVCIIVAISLLDWNRTIQAIKQLTIMYTFLACIVCFFQFIFMGWRWYLLVKDDCKCSFLPVFKDFLYSSMLNIFTPANIGGDVYRYIYIKKWCSESHRVIRCIMEERILGLFAFLVSYCIFYGISWYSGYIPAIQRSLYHLVGACALAASFVLLLLPRLAMKLAQYAENHFTNDLIQLLMKEGIGPRLFSWQGMLLNFLSFMAISCWISTCWIVSNQMGGTLPFPMLSCIAILVELIRLVPISIQGLGMREGSFAYLFHLSGQSPELGFLVATISYMLLNIVFCFNAMLSISLPLTNSNRA